MKKFLLYSILLFLVLTASMACVTKKKRNETSKLGKFYQNTTAYYNGYWNSKEIMKESLKLLRAANVDDYNNILEVEDFVAVTDPKMVKADMDKIQEKVSTVAQLHEASDWVDDCYVMMGKAQYMKQEYETAEETLEYFQEDFNPSNPYGRNYKHKKPTGKAAKKAREAEKKEKEKERKKAAEAKQELKEEKAKTKEEERKAKAKEREKAKKEKEKQRKIDAKNRKKGIKTEKPKVEESKETPKTSSQLPNEKTEVVKPIEEEIKPLPPVKQEEDKTAFSEGMLWLAKTYIKRENWFAAQILLEKLDKSVVSDDIKAELPATKANLFIKQKRYSEALPFLDIAIDEEDNDNLKARYAFIAGQISQLNNNTDEALKYFAIAAKNTSQTKMEFMAELAVAKNAILSGKKSKDQVIKDLTKLLDQNKYIELKDQIYFTMAEIELSQKNEAKAIEYYKKSLAANLGDQRLQSEAYYRIANLHYNSEKYLLASNYYDSTLQVLPLTDVRQPQVKRYVDNLKDIAANLEIINYQDTLLYFASLESPDKEKLIKSYLERNKVVTVEPTKSTNLSSKQINVSSGVDFGTSTFFAYNKTAKEKGKADFDKIWGKRTLEDDWRRSNKTSSSLASDTNDQNDANVSEADATVEKVSKEDYNNYLRDIPSNPVKVKEANDKIMAAMFVLGKLFRDKIENYRKSAETLENMHTRYGPTQYELDSYFYLYLDYLDLENQAKVEEYKKNIIKKYPDSKYAALISDSNGFSHKNNNIDKSDQYYEKVYSLYSNGEYQKALLAINQSNSVIESGSVYEPKMALIKAMCLGNIEGREAYVKELSGIISTYPNTPEQLKAKEILRFLGGDKSAFAEIRDVDKIFQRDETSMHYVAVVTYGLEESDHVNFKIAISEYNKKNYKTDKLQFGDGTLNMHEKAEVILIRKFDNETKAVEYYQKAIKDFDEFSGGAKFTYDILPISQSNYRKMMSENSTVGYRKYFENYILK